MMIARAFALGAVALGGFLAAGLSTASAGEGWSGCYVGANLGFAGGATTATDSPFTQGPGAGTGTAWNAVGAPYDVIAADGNGSLLGGLEAGCDQQVTTDGLALVLGGVVDLGVVNISGQGTSGASADTHVSFDTHWLGSLRARIGVASPDALFYATGGLALAGVDLRAYDTISPSMDVTNGGLAGGWVAGVGAEWRFAEQTSLSLEYLHYGLSGTATGESADLPGAFPRFVNDLGFDAVRVGLKWRL